MGFTISKDIVLTQDKTNSTIESFITQFLLRKIDEQSPTGQEEGWSNTPPTLVAADQEVWVRTKITYKKGNITWSEYNPGIIGYKDATWENIVKSQTDIVNIQKQVDKSIDVWYDYGEPVIKDENENIISFYRQWEENEDSYHIGDIYYDLNTTNSYRFIKDEANNYNWSKVQDTQTSALVTQIKDLKDNKVSIYSSENYPEKAQINDLFFPSTGNGISYKCIASYDNKTTEASERPGKWAYIQGSGIVLIQYKAVKRNLNDSSLEQELLNNTGWLEEMPIFSNETEIYQRTAIKWENAYIHIGEVINISAGQKTIDRIINYYLITSDSTKPTIENNSWVGDEDNSFSLPNPNVEKPYLWNYEKIIYSNNATATTPVTLIGNYSLEGKAIVQVLEYYKTTNSITPPDRPENFDELKDDETWVTEIEALSDSNPYLWNIEVIEYSEEVSGTSEKQSSYELTDPIMIGYKGRDGNHYITISCNPDISSGRITIQENQEIILTATYHIGDSLAEDSEVKYAWYKNKSSSVSPISTSKTCEITLAVDSEENSYTCKCQYNNGDEISETICFSKIPKTLGYQLQSTNPANRFLSVNPETKKKSIVVRPTELQLTLHEVINEQQIESSALSIWAKRPKGGYQEAKFEETYFIFDLSKWYVENFVVDNQHPDVFSENIDFYLDNEGQTYIGSIPFADATPDEILKLVETAYSMNWLIDNNAMVFDTNGLHLYNGNFEICKAETDSNGNIIADKLNEAESVLYFDSEKAQLVVKGHIEAESGSFKGYIEAKQGKIGGENGWTIDTGRIWSINSDKDQFWITTDRSISGNWIEAITSDGSKPFYVTHKGILHATDAVISGTIIAGKGGQIGGWYIDTDCIKSEIPNTYKQFALNSALNTSSKWIEAYDENNKETFYLAKTGALYATKGTIGGCTIDEDGIYSGSGSNTAGIGVQKKRSAFWAGGTLNDAANGTANFAVSHAGILKAKGVEISGTLENRKELSEKGYHFSSSIDYNANVAKRAKRIASGAETANADDFSELDIDQDGVITAFDAQLILRKSVNLSMPTGNVSTRISDHGITIVFCPSGGEAKILFAATPSGVMINDVEVEAYIEAIARKVVDEFGKN